VQELIDYARANPGKINWASSGIGSGGHLAIELVQIKTGIKVVHVVYKGAGPGTDSRDGRRLAMMFGGPGVFMPHLKSGRVRALAIGQSAAHPHSARHADAHTESGLPGMEQVPGTASWRPRARPRRSSAQCTRRR